MWVGGSFPPQTLCDLREPLMDYPNWWPKGVPLHESQAQDRITRYNTGQLFKSEL